MEWVRISLSCERALTTHLKATASQCYSNLDATSTIVFYGDEDVSGSYTYIQQRTYPDGKDLGTYWGGGSGGFTTIPNRLPN